MRPAPMIGPIDLRITLDRQLHILAIDTTADFETFHLDTNAVGKSLEELGPAVHDLIDAIHDVLANGRPVRCERLEAFAGASAVLQPISSQSGVILGVELGLSSAAESANSRAQPAPPASQTLEAFAARLFAQLSLEHVACEAITHVAELCGADNTAVLIYDELEGHLIVRAVQGFHSALTLDAHVPASEGLVGQLLALHRPVVRTDSSEFPELAALFGVPLLVGNRVVGVVLAGTRASHGFTPHDVERVLAAAGPMALALDHARQYEAEHSARTSAEQTVDRVMRLQSVTAALTSILTPAQTANVVLEQVMAAMNASAGIVRLLTADHDGLVDVASRGFSEPYRDGMFWIALDAPFPMGEAVRRLMPLLYSDLHELQSQFPNSVERFRNEGIQSVAILPMAIHHQPIGVVTLAFHERRQFTHDDRVFMAALMQVCSQTMERAHLYGAEQAARRTADEARAQINTLFVTAPIGMALVDREFRFVRINEYLTQFNGIAMDQQLGQRARDLFPEFAEVWEHSWWQVIESGEPLVDMAASVVLGGEERHLLMSYYPMRLPDGEITGVGTIVLDVSDRERVDRATALLAEASRELVGSVDYPTTLAGVARVAVPVLADFCIVTLFSERQSATVAAVVHRDRAREDMLRAVATRLASTSDAVSNPIGIAFKSQHAIFIPDLEALLSAPNIEPEVLAAARAFNARSLIVVPLRLRETTIGALSFVMTDSGRSYRQSDIALAEELAWRCSQAIEITRLYAAEHLARRSAERAAGRIAQIQAVTSSLAEALTPEHVASVIATRGAAAIEARYCSIALLSDDGTRLETLPMPSGHAFANRPRRFYPLSQDSPMSEAVRSNTTILFTSRRDLIERYPHSEGLFGEDDPESSSGAAVPLVVNNRVIGAMAFGFSATRPIVEDDMVFVELLAQQCAQALERARLYEAERSMRAAAEAAVHLRDQFLAIAAHELKTPLTTLLGNAELFQRRHARDQLLTERDRRNLTMIIEQSRRLNRMISALLDISRIQSGQLSIEQVPINLGRLVQRVITEVRLSLTQHVIEEDISGQNLLIMGDELRLEQVLQNLLQNAIKYSPTGGVIRVTLTHQDDTAYISVSDEGIGVPADALPLVFQRFYRANNADPRHISGMGVGLYVVREILQLHGGLIDVESVEGSGSTFTVTLPLLTASLEAAR